MSHTAPDEPQSELGNKVSGFVLSLLRTFVPGVWGAVLSWLLLNIPAVADLLGLHEGAPAPAWIFPLIMLGWYALWRKIEPALPAWLTRLVLGANTRPVYPS